MMFFEGEFVCVKTLAELKAEFHNFVQGMYGGMVVLPSGHCFHSAMEPYGGKVCKIKCVTESGYYIEGSDCLFTAEMLKKSRIGINIGIMILATIKKMDQKNRTHIPMDYMKLAGIKENGEVVVTVDTKIKQITITAPDEDYYDETN